MCDFKSIYELSFYKKMIVNNAYGFEFFEYIVGCTFAKINKNG